MDAYTISLILMAVITAINLNMLDRRITKLENEKNKKGCGEDPGAAASTRRSRD
jgi:hypothetical protein